MYVDARLHNGKIYMSSYTKTGEREVTTHLPPYVFYYTDKAGKYDSIDRKKLSRSRTNSYRAFQKSIDEKKSNGSEIYESDVNVVYRLLEERFNTTDLPSLKISIIDIECDKDPNRSYSNVASPYSIVNAITIHNKWQDKYYTIVVKPETFDSSESLTEYLAKDSGDGFGSMTSEDGYFVVDTEEDLLWHTLELISDADVISGWNSTSSICHILCNVCESSWGVRALKKYLLKMEKDFHSNLLQIASNIF